MIITSLSLNGSTKGSGIGRPGTVTMNVLVMAFDWPRLTSGRIVNAGRPPPGGKMKVPPNPPANPAIAAAMGPLASEPAKRSAAARMVASGGPTNGNIPTARYTHGAIDRSVRTVDVPARPTTIDGGVIVVNRSGHFGM